ncbi:unnamed protein product [Rotaria magnacalcarata]|uniref:Uncharacterized protein n=1 Tax=Rotaria magnacalcarata TaxID=392030 RepID=A0A819J3K7_9BILA|nr:unnamed protein product [Rotaria magnacalcarata]CAF3940539.1 unnamed protein product [Rotaria magnacalcarata]CAF3964780.1 unnamed protein product [Rotaria magnacalcarata]
MDTTQSVFGSQHGFQNTPNKLKFLSYETPSNFTDEMPKIANRLHMNLWLYESVPPANRKEVEIPCQSLILDHGVVFQIAAELS